ncbi:hypothetical protein [Nitrospirillum sp. BR 11163]|uniref:hypothetical protein n=1 Tax=Nitrospirillum sp. BR 11163 TaxID=3104323 RepID=UPI002AFE16D9|nr:hypothetical protein [Nitrospirillum sp. BR 11163]MEA1677482.1 hypothetical protein [Nitrospirillum sp. BR 11163]
MPFYRFIVHGVDKGRPRGFYTTRHAYARTQQAAANRILVGVTKEFTTGASAGLWRSAAPTLTIEEAWRIGLGELFKAPNKGSTFYDERPGDIEASPRLVDQRARNRIMEQLLSLADGDANVLAFGIVDYFEGFFDWFPYEGDPTWFPAMTEEEAAALREVCRMMQAANDATDRHISAEALIATGWPGRVAPVAREALELMRARGHFSEEKEEDIPTGLPWPGRDYSASSL